MTIEVEGTTKNAGGIGGGRGGTITFNLILRSPQLGRMQLPVTVDDYPNLETSLEVARLALIEFADGLKEAAQQPLG